MRTNIRPDVRARFRRILKRVDQALAEERERIRAMPMPATHEKWRWTMGARSLMRDRIQRRSADAVIAVSIDDLMGLSGKSTKAMLRRFVQPDLVTATPEPGTVAVVLNGDERRLGAIVAGLREVGRPVRCYR